MEEEADAWDRHCDGKANESGTHIVSEREQQGDELGVLFVEGDERSKSSFQWNNLVQ